MKTVLITGVAGFLGSHLADKFISEGFFVIGMDNFLTGTPDNISHLLENKNFKFIYYNVTNYIYIKEEIDIILHFACPASPMDYRNFPIQTMKVDSLGTLHTLGLAKVKGARYVFASTSEVYGDPKVHPQSEDYWGYVNPTGERAVYDEAKRFSEAMTMTYHRVHGIDVRIVRIFNTYGPRMKVDDGRVIPTFIWQALNDEPLTVFGDGSQTRSFSYVDDTVKAIYEISIRDGLSGEVFNVGNPHEIKIIELTKLIGDILGKEIKIESKPLPSDDPKRRCPDITKINNVIGWEPEIDIREGLERTINYFAQIKK